MTNSSTGFPVHGSLQVLNSEDIYHNSEWWKSVVNYQYEDAESTETAVYLWHKDDGEWTRKNKYVIKTVDAWETDREVIETLLDAENPNTEGGDFPVSDYYHAAAGVTVFQSENWWKAILLIDKKGTYETEEIMVYLWQLTDGEWRRRQKYTIKDRESWEEERVAIESVLGVVDESVSSPTQSSQETPSQERSNDLELDMSEELADLDAELEAHLSESTEQIR